MPGYDDKYWQSGDGLRLHYRDYPGRADRPPILCLPGLTRNARDYEVLADRLAGEWRVISVDLRGRGESGYAKDSMSYVPQRYVEDVEALLGELGGGRFVAFGTSLGGIVAMLLAASAPDRIAGALLNDIGPAINAAGVTRIRSYVGKPSSWPTWMHAARAVKEAHAAAFPGYEIAHWLAMAKRLYRLNSAGRVVLDYDLKIAEPLRISGNESGGDLWQSLAALKDVPTLIVHGERSDVLTRETADRMLSTLDRADLVAVPGIGHAPTLDEPEATAAIDRLLEAIAREPVPA